MKQSELFWGCFNRSCFVCVSCWYNKNICDFVACDASGRFVTVSKLSPCKYRKDVRGTLLFSLNVYKAASGCAYYPRYYYFSCSN